MCEYATETGRLQKNVEIKHIDDENNLDEKNTQLLIVDSYDKSKPAETHLEVKIEVKRENVDLGDSSLLPEKGNETFPEDWKIRPVKHKNARPP